ncbi:phosphotriesterase [Halorhabdus sp. CBA1104]|uniref:phosphotriesterase family protein n=1 Tax=Halorhabdus sp. CBA1104 TaxID=1380432 RepID=UPI001E4F990C|nr:esterase [Halorhabdus sp. CBA1104]
MGKLSTTQGTIDRDEIGLLVPHEHIFADLGPMEAENWKDTDPEAVIELIGPEIERAKEAGIDALVECTPEGVGRRVDIDLAVSEATDFPVVVPTGIYQETSIPQWAREMGVAELTEWMLDELTNEIEDTGVRAAWIKVSTDDDDPEGLSDDEEKILRAAARAGAETGAVIGSHTLHGNVAHQQLDIIAEEGYDPSRFIWIHARAEENLDYHERAAKRGAFVEYDWIGGHDQDDQTYIDLVEYMTERGYTDNILLSQDRGYYDPSQPDGGEVDPYTYIVEKFLPKLRAANVPDAAIDTIVHENPLDAYCR